MLWEERGGAAGDFNACHAHKISNKHLENNGDSLFKKL